MIDNPVRHIDWPPMTEKNAMIIFEIEYENLKYPNFKNVLYMFSQSGSHSFRNIVPLLDRDIKVNFK